MPSPSDLPFVYLGMVWDGVTEYANTLPPDAVGEEWWLLRLDDEGRRQIFEERSAGLDPMTRLRARRDLTGWVTIGITNEHAVRKIGWFLGYDGVLSETPVNQIAYTWPYREHTARFAHQLDAAMGHHSLLSAEEEDRLTTLQTLSAMLGSAWIRYNTWDAIDPTELVVGGVNDGLPLWGIDLADYQAIDVAVCGQCDIATFARRFYFHADLAGFRRLWRSGIIYSVDRTATPWTPTLFDVAPPADSDWYGTLNAAYHAALNYYDTVVGPAAHT